MLNLAESNCSPLHSRSMKTDQSLLKRRNFAKSAAIAAAASPVFGFQFVPSRVWGANSKVQLAGIGSGGKGRVDIAESAKTGMHVAALVDVVDTTRLHVPKGLEAKKLRSRLESLQSTRESFSKARFFSDYREMLHEMGDKIDAVTVSTPDHHHFHATALAMKAGKHVYCQKPLTHGIWEARALTDLAKRSGVKTQMGNQAHANDHLRRVVELLRAGVIGKVSEVHAWTNRPIWPQGFSSPPPPHDPPPGINWEQWIGPAPPVGYSPQIAPFAWRGWWNYGTGALGDMACHIMDLPYWGLGLTSPVSVRAEEVGGSEISPPIHSTITFDFAREGVKLYWYDGQIGARFNPEKWRLEKGEFNRPGEDILEGADHRRFGCVIVGEYGKLFFNRFKDTWFVKPGKILDQFETSPEQSVPRARGQNNYAEWLDAIEGEVDRGQSDFSYSGPFTETVLLGCVAQRRPGETLHWNAKSLTFEGRPDLDDLIRRPYRIGWEIEV